MPQASVARPMLRARVRRRGLRGWLFGCGVVSLACGGGRTVDDDSYPSRYARAVCEVMDRCCLQNGLEFDSGNCQLGAAGFVASGRERALAAGAVEDTMSQDQCIEAAVSLTSSCTPFAGDALTTFPCSRTWFGPRSTGEACTADVECASSNVGRGACYLLTDPAEDPVGVCVIETPEARVGDVCGAPPGLDPPLTLAVCRVSGLRCDVATHTCQRRREVGEECSFFEPCVGNAFCDASGLCVAALNAGTSCSEDQECLSGFCMDEICANNGVGRPLPCVGQ